MNTAHNTLIQFLHARPEFSLLVDKHKSKDDWHVGLIDKNLVEMQEYGYGPSYEAACANLAAQLPKL